MYSVFAVHHRHTLMMPTWKGTHHSLEGPKIFLRHPLCATLHVPSLIQATPPAPPLLCPHTWDRTSWTTGAAGPALPPALPHHLTTRQVHLQPAVWPGPQKAVKQGVSATTALPIAQRKFGTVWLREDIHSLPRFPQVHRTTLIMGVTARTTCHGAAHQNPCQWQVQAAANAPNKLSLTGTTTRWRNGSGNAQLPALYIIDNAVFLRTAWGS